MKLILIGTIAIFLFIGLFLAKERTLPIDKPVGVSIEDTTAINSILKNTNIINSNLKLGISYPPVSDKKQRTFTINHLQKLQTNQIRFSEHWIYREPQKGSFKWESMDERIEWVRNNNLSLLLTIESNGPDWACDSSKQNEKSCVYTNTEDFSNYVGALLQRYPNQISKIQFGNEWMSNFHYIGSAEEFVRFNNILFKQVKKYSPQTKVVLGGFTTSSLRALAGCDKNISFFYIDDVLWCNQDLFLCEGTFIDIPNTCTSTGGVAVFGRISSVLEKARYDIVDLHFYDDVENWGKYYQTIKSKTNKPIIVTEFGGPYISECNESKSDCTLGKIEKEKNYSDEYHAQRVAQYINVLSTLDIDEAYYFKLVESESVNPTHIKSGLIDNQLNEKIGYFVFKALNKILKQ